MLRLVSHDLLTIGRPELSAEIIWKAVRADPNNAVLWHELSAIQSTLGESPEVCLHAVQRAIQLAPVTTEYRVTAATLMIRLDQTGRPTRSSAKSSRLSTLNSIVRAVYGV